MVAFLLIAGAASYGLAIAGESLFPLREVLVSGAEGLTQEQVESIVSEYAPFGRSLLLFRSGGLVRRLEAESLVARVRVHRRLPHTLLLEFTQREPLAAVVGQGGEGWVCDGEGVILGPSGGEKRNLPVVELEGVVARHTSSGTRLTGADVRAALRGICLLGALRGELPERVCVSSGRGMEIILVGGTELRLGLPVRLEEKLACCAEVLKSSRGREQVRLIDVSCPDHSYYEVGSL